jgi:hypothetical protein
MASDDAIRSIMQALVRNPDRPLGWDPQQPQLQAPPQVAGPYDLMPARTPQEQALRDLIFSNRPVR